MLSREEHQQSLISSMLSIMSLILNEEEAPQPLLEVVLQNLRKNGEVKLSAQYMHCCYIAALSAKQTFFFPVAPTEITDGSVYQGHTMHAMLFVKIREGSIAC